jgi:hypothetical protein
MDKPIRIFPILNDIKPFLCQEHPVYHPDTLDYENYWEDQEKKCIEGLWGLDKKGDEGGWRYMTPQLYYYVNISKIIDQGEDGQPTVETNPLLRDIEWVFAYGWLAAKRFSGFIDDEEFTCHRVVDKVERNIPLTPKEQIDLNTAKYVRRADGSLKTYVYAVDYLYKTHEKPLGRPVYENQSLNLFVLGSRGLGKSYFTANAVIGHEYIFDGMKEYGAKPSAIKVFVGAAISDKSSELLTKFQLTNRYLESEVGAWGAYEDFIPGWFYKAHLGTLSPNNGKSPYRNSFDIKSGKSSYRQAGTGSSILHGIYTTENPQAAVGNRPSVMVIEEVGLVGNLLAVHGANETCLILRDRVGSAIYLGTGGNMEKITEPKIVFERAEAYNCVGYPDPWENRMHKMGLFIPGYYADNSFKDENGNTDIEASFAQEMYDRKVKSDSGDNTALDSQLMSRPIKPSEMFLQSNGNIFPTALLQEQLNRVEIDGIFDIVATIGSLEYTDDSKKEVRFIPDLTKKNRPIKELSLDSYNGRLTGATVIYEFPCDPLPEPSYRRSLYKVVCDPVKDDNGGTSLYSVIVWKGWPDKGLDGGLRNTIVAEWIGRLNSLYEMHEMAVKFALFYNAKLLPEVTLPDIINYVKTHRKMPHILQWNPRTAISKVLKDPSFKYDVGVYMSSKELKVQAAWLLKGLLEAPISKDEYGNVISRNLNNIFSPRILKELIQYNYDENFDHVSSLLILALWLSEEVEAPVEKQETRSARIKEINNYLNNVVKTQNQINVRY